MLPRQSLRQHLPAVAEVLAILGIALVPRVIGTDHPPYIDELYNVLAARSLVSEGTLEIGQAMPYRRGLLHTLIVAGMFRLFGTGLEAARLPGIVFGTALVGLVFVWVRSVAGRLEAWIAALLLAFYPAAIALSQIGRFYPAQVLLFWIGALAVYRSFLVGRDPGSAHVDRVERSADFDVPEPGAAVVGERRSPFPDTAGKRHAALPGLVVAAIAFATALHFQRVTVIGIGGVIAAVVILRGGDAVRWAGARRIPLRAIAAAAVVAIAGAIVAAPVVARAWRLFNQGDLWAHEHWHNPIFYHERFLELYGPLWLLLPVLLIVAIRKRPAAAILATAIFALAFGFHSLAMWKNERYIHYAMPAFFILVGIGSGALVRSARAAALPAAKSHRQARLRAFAFWSGTIAAAAAVLSFGSAPGTVLRMATLDAPDRPQPYPPSDWEAARPHLRPALDRARDVIASADLKALFFLGRLDYDLLADHLYDRVRFLPDFTPQRATGIPAIRSADAVQRIVDCVPTGLIAIEQDHWRTVDGVPAETADRIESIARPIAVPASTRILAFEWGDAVSGGEAAPVSPACSALPAR